MRAKLEVIKGPERGKSFVLDEPTTCVAGRAADARFRFSEDDPYISRRHFLLEMAPPRIYFRDLEVANPSRINDCYVEEAELCDGDVIEVGFTILKVHLEPESLADDAPAASDETTQLEERPAAAPAGAPIKACCECGRDLTANANSDGRAQELDEIVEYVCRRCVRKLADGRIAQVGGYDLIEKLGEGGMGTVFLAYHGATARLAALKMMNIQDRDLAARFSREIRVMRKIVHPSVLAYIDSGVDETSGRPYLVMEYARLGSLDDLVIEHDDGVPARDATRYIIQALDGLSHVHQQGIVHRDLKPENILLAKDHAGAPRPKVADFGLAREFSRAGGSVLTQLGKPMGTILYMPPEQIRDAHSVREPSDVYSMGVTLYYLLTGRYHFDFPTPADILRFLAENRGKVQSPDEALKLLMREGKLKSPFLMILEDEPIAVGKRKPALDQDLARVVDKAITKDIYHRYQSASEFRDALANVAR